MAVTLHEGDCAEVFRFVRGLGAIVSDLPAGIGFMGRAWDRPPKGTGYRSNLPPRNRAHERAMQDREAWVSYWAERLAIGYDACADDAIALVWTIPRTSGWTQEALLRAGWEVVDQVAHLFGQGWPKTPGVLKPAREDWVVARKGRGVMNVEACRVERGGEYTDAVFDTGTRALFGSRSTADRMAIPGNPAGSRPANVVLSHAEGCVARGVRRVRGGNDPRRSDGTRDHSGLLMGGGTKPSSHAGFGSDGTEAIPAYDCLAACDAGHSWLAPAGGPPPRCPECGAAGWWACPVAEVDALSGNCPSGGGNGHRSSGVNLSLRGPNTERVTTDGAPPSFGGASRFFNRFGYYAKCPSGERHAGAEHLLWAADPARPFGFRRVTREEWDGLPETVREKREISGTTTRTDPRAQGNVHPTVKRIALMRWLHALAGGGPIGDLCAGSGSGAIAAHLDGIDWIGAEVCPEAIEIAEARLTWWQGLSHAAAAEFLATDVVPRPTSEADPRQVTLFGGV